MQQLNLQLYGRTARGRFNEELSSRRSLSLTPDPATVELSLIAPEGEKFVELRLDPDNKPSAFVLLGLKIQSTSGEELYTWDGKADGLAARADIEISSENAEVVIESRSDDPFLLLPLAHPHPDVVAEVRVASRLTGIDQQSLAEAIRSLQSVFRFALDDLAAEQEGLQDALLLQQAHARDKDRAAQKQLSDVLGRTASLEDAVAKTAEQTRNVILAEVLRRTSSLDDSVANAAKQTQDVLLGEIRDDWRSLRQQIADAAEAAAQQRHETEASMSANIRAELGKLIQAVSSLAASQNAMNQVRHELHVLSDEDAIAKIRQLKADAAAARARVEAMEGSLAWRLTHPFRTS